MITEILAIISVAVVSIISYKMFPTIKRRLEDNREKKIFTILNIQKDEKKKTYIQQGKKISSVTYHDKISSPVNFPEGISYVEILNQPIRLNRTIKKYNRVIDNTMNRYIRSLRRDIDQNLLNDIRNDCNTHVTGSSVKIYSTTKNRYALIRSSMVTSMSKVVDSEKTSSQDKEILYRMIEVLLSIKRQMIIEILFGKTRKIVEINSCYLINGKKKILYSNIRDDDTMILIDEKKGILIIKEIKGKKLLPVFVDIPDDYKTIKKIASMTKICVKMTEVHINRMLTKIKEEETDTIIEECIT